MALTGKKIETNPSNSIRVGSHGRKYAKKQWLPRVARALEIHFGRAISNAIRYESLRRDAHYKGLSYSRLDVPGRIVFRKYGLGEYNE